MNYLKKRIGIEFKGGPVVSVVILILKMDSILFIVVGYKDFEFYIVSLFEKSISILLSLNLL